MWRAFAAVLLFVAPAFAQEENATAYEALRVVGTELGRDALNHVVSITGVKGDPQPRKVENYFRRPPMVVACVNWKSPMERLVPSIGRVARLRVPPKAQRSTPPA